jgi:Rps23 Pro-64 3,4-dihydroxylase Tpa1-like proline 4-hydroxylase
MKHISIDNLNSENIKKYSQQFRSSTPSSHVVIDNFLTTESAEKILCNFDLNKHWGNFYSVNNQKHFSLTDTKFMDKNCSELYQELASEDFINPLKQIIGINNVFFNWDTSGLFQTLSGGNCSLHTDSATHTVERKWRRVINILLYFNKNWIDDYNGGLELWDENLKHKVRSVSPIFNRCLIFKTDRKSWHGYPDKINCPPNMSRKLLTAWYFLEEDKKIKLYPTRYRPRPSDSYFYGFLVHTDTFLTKVFSFLRSRRIINDQVACKILDILHNIFSLKRR